MIGTAVERCPLCLRDSGERIQSHPDFYGLHIWRCSSCDFWFAAPSPSAEYLADYYRTVYGQRRTAVTAKPYLAIMRRRARAQTAFIRPRTHRIQTAIDIGCGVGALVAALARQGVNAIGYDPDQLAIETGRSVFRANIHQGHVHRYDGLNCDLLCLSHILEHLPNPVAALGQLLTPVRPGGYIFVEVPQCNPWMFRQRVPTESHLSFFTLRSLESLARTLKLTVRQIANCGPDIIDYYSRDHTSATPQSDWPSPLQSILRGSRIERIAKRFSPVRTEFDGYFRSYSPRGCETRMWIRALFELSR